MKKKNSISRFCIVLVLLFSFYACENDLAEVEQFKGKMDVSIETAKEVEILYSDSAIVRVKITAPLLYFHRDPKNPHKEFPSGVAVDFYGSDLRAKSRLTAKKAFQYERKYQVIAKDSVILLGNRDTLITEELIWDERKGTIISSKFVQINRPDDEAWWGYGFESNQDFTDWKIFSVTGIRRAGEFVEENIQ